MKSIVTFIASLSTALLFSTTVFAEDPSPAELALQAQQEAQRAAQFQIICEHILSGNNADQRQALITQLDGQTCEEAAQVSMPSGE